MKLARRLVTLAIVLAMVMAFMIPTAMAATINVQDVVDGETYTAYKILNYTNSGDAYSYYLSATEHTAIGTILKAAGFKFTASADGSQYFVDNVEGFDAAAAAAYLAEHVNDLGDALEKVTATGADGKASFTDLDTGYYFVTSTTGSLCALHSDTDIAQAVEKNTVPSVVKQQKATEDAAYAETTLHLNMGDTVYYQIKVTNGKGTDKAIELTDTLSAGLTLNQSSITVKAGDKDVDAANYTVTNKTTQGFKLTLLADYVKTLAENAVVTIEYSAVVDTDAVVDNAEGNSNTVKMEYSEQKMEKVVYVATYDFIVNKTDEDDKPLTGAKFNLYDAETGGNQIKLAADVVEGAPTGYYVSADGTAVIEAGTNVNVRGLKPGTYYLEEIEAPAGYNKLPARVAVKITSGATEATTITVENQAGVVLPSTGGMGTTIFYVLGGMMFLGALVVLFTNKRMRQN